MMPETNEEMVDYLAERDFLSNTSVEEAMREVDRARFVPRTAQTYADRPVRIGEGSTVSAPHIVAKNTELLAPESAETIVEVGSGSGYQVAVLAEIVGKVVGVEIQKDLVERSRRNLEVWENAEVVRGDGIEAFEGESEKILYSCAITKKELKKAEDRFELVVGPVKRSGQQYLVRSLNGQREFFGRVRFVDKK